MHLKFLVLSPVSSLASHKSVHHLCSIEKNLRGAQEREYQDNYPLVYPWGVLSRPKAEFAATPETENIGEFVESDASTSTSARNGAYHSHSGISLELW